MGLNPIQFNRQGVVRSEHSRLGGQSMSILVRDRRLIDDVVSFSSTRTLLQSRRDGFWRVGRGWSGRSLQQVTPIQAVEIID